MLVLFFSMEKQPKPLFKLSPSSLHLFLECPRCFWLEKVKKISRPDSIFPSLPSGMDKILKEHFDRFMDKGLLPPELHTNGLQNYKLFSDKALLKIWRNNLKGIEWLDTATNILLRGAVDNILVKGNKHIVLDYKTRGFPLKEDTHEHYVLQMDIYNLLLRKNGYLTEDYSYLLFYYPKEVLKTGEVVFETVVKKMIVNIANGQKVFQEACAVLLQEDPPEPSGACGFCHWAKGMLEE